MAIQSPALDFRISSGVADTTRLLSEQNYYAQRNVTPQQLTSKLIYYMGRANRHAFPLATRLLGGGFFDISGMDKMESSEEAPFNVNTAIKYIEDTQEFSYPVMTNYRDGSAVGETLAGTTNGLGMQSIKVKFKTNVLIKDYIVRSPFGTQARVENIENAHPYWIYTLRLASGNAKHVFPESELKAGTIWINMFSAVAESGSRNIDIARAITPSAYKNQITKMRTGLSWEGESALKRVNFHVFADRDKNGDIELDKATNKKMYKWLDQYMYNYELDNFKMIESALWYSEYNKASNGQVGLKDPNTGKPIAIGAGILQQVLNKVKYSNFSYNLLEKVIGKAFYGIRGTPKTKTLYTGRLGFRKFDKAMKEAGYQFLTDWGFVADKFVTGSDYSLMLGGYFDGFYHVDGWIIKVKKTEIFDNGGLITNSPIDEESGLPWESARMLLLDDGDYEGEPNIQLVLKRGFEPYTHAIMKGFNHLPPSVAALSDNSTLTDSKNLGEVTSDLEKSCYMRMYQMGVQLLRGNTSVDFQFNPTM